MQLKQLPASKINWLASPNRLLQQQFFVRDFSARNVKIKRIHLLCLICRTTLYKVYVCGMPTRTPAAHPVHRVCRYYGRLCTTYAPAERIALVTNAHLAAYLLRADLRNSGRNVTRDLVVGFRDAFESSHVYASDEIYRSSDQSADRVNDNIVTIAL